MPTPTYQALPDTIRVKLPAPLESCFVLVVPDPDEGPSYRDFYIVTPNNPGEFMFGCVVANNFEATRIALMNAPDYIDREIFIAAGSKVHKEKDG